MKLILLDIDGVLNNEHTRTTTHDGWCFVDDYLVERFGRLVKESGAKVVLSSTWRVGWNRDDESLNEPFFNQLRDKLKEYDIEIWDMLPLPISSRRSRSIEKYFEDYRGPFITNYVIIDDWNDMDEYSSHLVLVNPIYGLRDEDIYKALDILNE